VERLGIFIVPVRILFGEDDYLDRITLAPRELYERLRREPLSPRTSQPPPGDFRRAYDLVLAHCENIVSVELSSRLSGTFQAAQIAARESGGKRILVFDTLNAAGGQGLITLAAAECALAGGDLDAVRAAAKLTQARTRTYALIRDLRYGVRGGRIPKIAQKLAGWLGATVLIANKDGLVRPFSALFGRSNLVERFAGVVARRAVPGCRYRAIVGHCDASDDAAHLAGALRERLASLDRIFVVETGPAVGVHAGPGSLVVGLECVPFGASGAATSIDAKE
jgi:DegV family protein with EDD domain